MKVELITGSTILESVKNTFKNIDVKDVDTEYFIVVPDRFTLKAEDLLFDTLGLSSIFNINIVSLTGLAKQILGKENIETINILDGVMLIQKAVQNLGDQLVFYKKSTPTFCYELLKNINQIKSCMISPEELLYDGNKEILKKKVQDIQLIYREYQRIRGEKKDSSDLIVECIDNIKSRACFKDKVLVFAGFDSFTELNYQLIKAGMSGAKKLVISLAKPLSLGNEYVYENDILEKIKKLASEEDISLEVISPQNSLNENQTILVKNLFNQSASVETSSYLSVSSSTSAKEEVQYIASLIKYRVYRGERFRSFSIGCSDLNRYGKLIERVFTEREIPFYLDSEVNMNSCALVVLLSKIFNLKKKNFQNEDLLYLIDSPLLDVENREELAAFVNERNINGRKGFYSHLKEKLPFVDYIVSKFDSCSVASDYVKTTREILATVQENFEKYLAELEENGLLKERSIEEQTPELIDKILSVLEKDEKCDFNNFLELFNLGTQNCNLSSLPAFCDAVFVGDMTNSYFGETDNLIVLGANRGKLPVAMSDNGLMSDADISDKGLFKQINPTIKMINRRNRFKLLSNLCLAKNKIYISFATSDEEGKPTDKAMFVDSLMKIFGVSEVICTSEISYFGVDKNFERYLFTLGGNRRSAELKLMEDLKDREMPASFIGSLQNVLQCDFENLTLNKETIKNPLLKENTFSVSRIEKYYDCPFKHFVDYALILKPKFTIDIQKNDKGSFYHAILEKFVKKYRENLKEVSSDEIRKFVEKNLDAILDFKQLEFLPDREIVRKEMKKDCIELCKRVVSEAKYSHFIPYRQEMSIVKKYELDGKEITLKGKVDRLDCVGSDEGEKFRIIDYKTGNISKNLYTELYYGKKVQLFIYSKVLREMLGQAPLGLYYFNANPGYVTKETPILEGVTLDGESIKDIDSRFNDINYKESKIIKATRKGDKIDYNSIDEKNLQALEKYAFDISSQALRQMAEGNIKTSPTEKSCEFCKYRAICLYNANDGCRIISSKKQEDLLKEDDQDE